MISVRFSSELGSRMQAVATGGGSDRPAARPITITVGGPAPVQDGSARETQRPARSSETGGTYWRASRAAAEATRRQQSRGDHTHQAPAAGATAGDTAAYEAVGRTKAPCLGCVKTSCKYKVPDDLLMGGVVQEGVLCRTCWTFVMRCAQRDGQSHKRCLNGPCPSHERRLRTFRLPPGVRFVFLLGDHATGKGVRACQPKPSARRTTHGGAGASASGAGSASAAAAGSHAAGARATHGAAAGDEGSLHLLLQAAGQSGNRQRAAAQAALAAAGAPTPTASGVTPHRVLPVGATPTASSLAVTLPPVVETRKRPRSPDAAAGTLQPASSRQRTVNVATHQAVTIQVLDAAGEDQVAGV